MLKFPPFAKPQNVSTNFTDNNITTNNMDKVRINYSKFDLKNGGKGVIAVLMYSGSGDPKIALDNAVLKLTDGIGYFELIDAHLDNPWTRVLLTDINDMVQEDLDPAKHNLKTLKNG